MKTSSLKEPFFSKFPSSAHGIVLCGRPLLFSAPWSSHRKSMREDEKCRTPKESRSCSSIKLIELIKSVGKQGMIHAGPTLYSSRGGKKDDMTHKERGLAILTNAAEGTLRELKARSSVHWEVGGETGGGHHAVQRQQGLRAAQCRQRPAEEQRREHNSNGFRPERSERF